MAKFQDQDLTGAEFRECDLSRTRLIGVVMQDVVIDRLVSNPVVNGVEVTSSEPPHRRIDADPRDARRSVESAQIDRICASRRLTNP
jgi:hypothetical protein